MKHIASPSFWRAYDDLPDAVRDTADKNFQLLKANPDHPSLHLKKVGLYWSVRVGIHYRALAVADGDDLVWFWIGHHGEYDRRIKDS